MIRRDVLSVLLCTVLVTSPSQGAVKPNGEPQSTVSRSLRFSDFLAAKLALDGVVDSATDSVAVQNEVTRLIAAARKLVGPRLSEGAKVDAVRKVLYQRGAWNDNRPFTYDRSDPFGENVRHKLLSHYLETRLGNCVTMPTLFMIVGRGIGLNLTLSTAPLHVFVRYNHTGLPPLNIEATSGGGFARNDWFRKKLPISERAIESGLYLRTHTDRETIAVMATTVLDYLASVGRNEEAIKVAEAILAANPKDGYTMVRKGSVIAAIMQAEFMDKYPIPALIPADLRPRYAKLVAANAEVFADAQALGWEPYSN